MGASPPALRSGGRPPPRKIRFRLLARLCRVGFVNHCAEELTTVRGGLISAVFPGVFESRSGSRTPKEFGVGGPMTTKPLFFSGSAPPKMFSEVDSLTRRVAMKGFRVRVSSSLLDFYLTL